MELDMKKYDIKGVLFDKDGTLWDFQKTWGNWADGMLQHLSDGDVELMSDLCRAISYNAENKEFLSDSSVIAGTGDEVAELLAPHLPKLQLSDIKLLMAEAAKAVSLVEVIPLEPFLNGLLEMGLKLGVATNDFEAVAIDNLGNLRSKFDFVAGFDSGFGAKPEPGMLNAFCEHAGLLPTQVLMVGDSTHDLLAAKAAGMPSVGVLTGVAGRDELDGLATFMCADIGEIPALFKYL